MFVSLWLIKQCSCSALQSRLIAKQQIKAEQWANWTKPHQRTKKKKKNLYIQCAQSNEVSVVLCQDFRVLLPNTTDHDSDRMQDLSWQLPCCLQQQIRNISIFTWITAMLKTQFSEQQPDEQHLVNISYFSQQLMKSQTNTLVAWTFLQTYFCNDYYLGRQLARKVVHPQLQSINLTLHLLSSHSHPPLLIKQCCLSGRISSDWWSPTVRLEHRERKDLGARLSDLWGVIPQINMEIMCKACVPIMLSHFFSKIIWNLCKAMHND